MSISCANTQSIVLNLAGDNTLRTSFDTYYYAIASKLDLSLLLTAKPTRRMDRNVIETINKRKQTFEKMIQIRSP